MQFKVFQCMKKTKFMTIKLKGNLYYCRKLELKTGNFYRFNTILEFSYLSIVVAMLEFIICLKKFMRFTDLP